VECDTCEHGFDDQGLCRDYIAVRVHNCTSDHDMFIYIDTETTDSGPADRLCQIAFKTEDGLTVNELFNPGMPISIDAMAVHHITNEMVQDKPSFRGSNAWNQLRDLVKSESNVMVAHNAAFDVEMLRKEGIKPKKVACTFKLARYFDKDGVIPRYGLQYLRYYLKLNVDATAHTALGDILVLEAIFQQIHAQAVEEFGDDAVAKIIEVSNKPVLYHRMPFGKHKGLKMKEVPADYLKWLAKTDLDEDLRYTVEHYLNS
jgi:DNA polymerase III epsilon subunit-like protein